MSQLDNAFTCHGQSWSGECKVCIDIENALEALKFFDEGNDQGWVTEYEKEYDNE
jgi:hypothetical protein